MSINCFVQAICVVSIIVVGATSDSDYENLPQCSQADYHYEYTACDSEGGRWRVSVPNPETCVGGRPPGPVRGQDCDFTCDAGEYLDINTDQECHPCPAGSYSLGGGVLYTQWNHIPLGFSAHTESFSIRDDETSLCKQMGWTPHNTFISTNNSQCVTNLVYSANLVRPGSVTFSYQFIDDSDDSVFTFEIQNSQCKTDKDESEHIDYLDKTDSDEWKTHRMSLKVGVSILYWRVYSILPTASKTQRIHKSVAIQSVQISGVAFTSNCTQCSAGTYSNKGSGSCEKCPLDTFSADGATHCTPCDSDTEYSGIGSRECLQRPVCTTDHYMMYYSHCVVGNTRKIYKWIEPKLCRDGVTLPDDGPMEMCPSCNIGMQLDNGTCQFCQHNEYSDGIERCKPCPGSTVPETSIVYKRWSNLPMNANITTRCMSLHGYKSDGAMGCITKDGWTMNNEYIETVLINADDVYLIVSLQVGGFHAVPSIDDRTSVANAELSFLFDTVCTADCEFLFFMQEDGKKTELIDSWRGSNTETAYRLPVTSNSAVKLTWAFRKSESSSEFRLNTDHAKIYLVNITNTLDGGASKCTKCPRGTGNYGCIPCHAGHYVDPDKLECVACPSNTIVYSSIAWGIESCLPCGAGLEAFNGQRCISHCKYSSLNGRQYDFSHLAKVQTVQGPRLFTPTGHAYFHLFNISLCGNNGMYDMAQCSHNMTSTTLSASKPEPVVNAHVCQSTILLSEDPSESIVAVSPISLGAQLASVTTNTDLNTTKLLSNAGFMPSPTELNTTQDLYLKYISQSPTAACRQGRTVIFVLRCTIKDKDDKDSVELPVKCPDGTCDGCNFVFMIKSELACPLCQPEDIETFTTACIDSKQKVISKRKINCNLHGSDLTVSEVEQECSLLWQDQWPIWLKVVIILVPVVLIGGVVLLLAVVYCWLKNKNLEYKYMKLIESSTGKYSEMPAPETCALDEGDDEEDEHFDAVKIRNGTKFFGKFKLPQNRGSGKMDDDSFETMQMTNKTSMT